MGYSSWGRKESDMTEVPEHKRTLYVYVNHSVVYLKVTQYCKSTIPQLKNKKKEKEKKWREISQNTKCT